MNLAPQYSGSIYSYPSPDFFNKIGQKPTFADAEFSKFRLGGGIARRSLSSRTGVVMKLPRRTFLHLAAGAATLPAMSRIAGAQAYPTRPCV
jgi:hypothetical protein